MRSASVDELYRRHYAEIVRFAARRVGPETAHDVAAEAFLIAWRKRDELPVGAERPWIFAIARRVAANELRSTGRRDRLALRARADATPVNPDVAEQVTERAAAAEALARLSAPLREALTLTDWDGLTPTEAAAVVGCSRGAFRVRLHRARRQLVAGYDAITRSDGTSPNETGPNGPKVVEEDES